MVVVISESISVGDIKRCVGVVGNGGSSEERSGGGDNIVRR